ncbi:two-component system, NarL family, nitrate/nitrite sensor histidine kinase NarQ [Lihuaxuella thermophila]|uniref:histidine kinase n=1 Tax=Lihuaxuella thermophila TaxID=1173111 RepID=A0A1H8HTG3_9BACL|nr:two-component system, NarL family, nitrate/nitrite sensor histidine kinase NarQ [Lihuaxuella thermophila]
MSYKSIKWLILILPTFVIGLWEYLRHTILLPYLSMELGNWLSPVIVFLVTITFLHKLFQIYENMQTQLNKEREEKAILYERERIARELHDGIAQTLFLCSVQVSRMKEKYPGPEWTELDKSLRQIHDYVRHSIYNLKNPPSKRCLQTRIEQLVQQFELDTGLDFHLDLKMEDVHLEPKEQVELFACLQEALTNIRKHADASQVWIRWLPKHRGWRLEVEDDGVGFQTDPFQPNGRFGLRIMRERVGELGGSFSFTRNNGKTRLVIEKEGE